MLQFRHSLFSNALSVSMFLILSCQQSVHAEENLFESAVEQQELSFHIDFSGVPSVSETLASFDQQEKLKIVQVDVGDIELKPINELNILQNSHAVTVVLAYRDIAEAKRIVVSVGDKKCTSIEFSLSGSNRWTESELRAIAAAECTT